MRFINTLATKHDHTHVVRTKQGCGTVTECGMFFATVPFTARAAPLDPPSYSHKKEGGGREASS